MRFLFSIFVVLSVFVSDAYAQEYVANSELRNLGMYFLIDPAQIARHLEITRGLSVTSYAQPDCIPVHILFRHNSSYPWMLCGTGGWTPRAPTRVFTVLHLFKYSGEYAVRHIGREVLEGFAPIVPIARLYYREGFGDSVICQLDTQNRLLFLPSISVEKYEEKVLKEEASEHRMKILNVPLKLHLLTRPKETFPVVGYVNLHTKKDGRVTPAYFCFVGDVVSGESGSPGYLEGPDFETSLFMVSRKLSDKQTSLIAADLKLPPKTRMAFGLLWDLTIVDR